MSEDPERGYLPPNYGPTAKRRSDPLGGEWERLDESPTASAQMIRWYAPETWEAIVRAHDDFREEPA